jgi:hypothetical protein
VQGGGYLVNEGGEVGRTTDLGQLPVAFQFLGDGEEIHRDAPFVQTIEGFPNPTMADNVKVIRQEKLRQVVVDFRVDHHRADDGFLGLTIMGRNGGRGEGGRFAGGGGDSGRSPGRFFRRIIHDDLFFRFFFAGGAAELLEEILKDIQPLLIHR